MSFTIRNGDGNWKIDNEGQKKKMKKKGFLFFFFFFGNRKPMTETARGNRKRRRRRSTRSWSWKRWNKEKLTINWIWFHWLVENEQWASKKWKKKKINKFFINNTNKKVKGQKRNRLIYIFIHFKTNFIVCQSKRK